MLKRYNDIVLFGISPLVGIVSGWPLLIVPKGCRNMADFDRRDARPECGMQGRATLMSAGDRGNRHFSGKEVLYAYFLDVWKIYTRFNTECL